MSNYKNIIPWIKKWEGGLSKATTDRASENPVPDGSGYHTNKGITWKTWSSIFGKDADSIKRFYEMSDSDWSKVYKKYYWDAIGGDNIKSQRIADILVNWAWGSGVYTPSVTIQKIVGAAQDGIIGKKTIEAINKGNESDIYEKLKNANIDFFDSLSKNPKYAANRDGWFNRLNDLYGNFIKKVSEKKKEISIAGILIVLAIVIYIIYTKNKK